MLHGAQVLGVHDVGAVLILERGEQLAGTAAVLQHQRLAGRRADTEGRHDLAQFVLAGGVGLVLPAAGVGAGALVGVAAVDVAGQQAAPGVGHAQRAVDEHFQLHARYPLADLGDFLQRQLAGQDHPA
ncbi:hypothetical protein D3C81_1160210 [compost metagenome]